MDRGTIDRGTKDKVQGETEDIAGRLQRQEGEWTGDKKEQARGAGKQAAGKAHKLVGAGKEQAAKGREKSAAGLDRLSTRLRGGKPKREDQAA